MNKLLEKIVKVANENLEKYLPEVKKKYQKKMVQFII